ncbi:MAG: UPF0149 family protein [Gammaproteobacteria bacterium]|nr:UPF0149 family protein [Gammaproteobacteria bacterium]
MTDHEPTYAAVDAALRRADSELTAAETHGLICAMLCADPGTPDARWMEEVVPAAGAGAAGAAEARVLLGRLRVDTASALAGEESGLRLLLPEDEAALSLRTQALVLWCEAFLYGLGLSGVQAERSLGPEGREVLADLVEVSRLDPEASGEEDERAYTEVSEFVRVAVMLLYEDLRERDQTDRPKVH